jgi:hypothetical protein
VPPTTENPVPTTENPAQMAVNMRVRLGYITQWKKGPKLEEAIALAKSIEAAIRILNPDLKAFEVGDEYKFQFQFEVITEAKENLTSGIKNEEKKRSSHPITLTLKKVVTDNGAKEWKAQVAELEAVLSLASYTRKLDYARWNERLENEKSPNEKKVTPEEQSDWPRKSEQDTILYNLELKTANGELNALVADLMWWGRDLHVRFKALKEHSKGITQEGGTIGSSSPSQWTLGLGDSKGKDCGNLAR